MSLEEHRREVYRIDREILKLLGERLGARGSRYD